MAQEHQIVGIDSAIPTAAAEPSTAVKYTYSKRYDASMAKERNDNCALSRQLLADANLSPASPSNARVFELGAFYEIDHQKLPPKSPIQLKAIRVVKVSEATSLEVAVSFPSTLALRNYFALLPEPGRYPELDERFVMSSNQAGRILRRPVLQRELERQKHLENFWLSTPNLYDSPSTVVPSASLMADEEFENNRASPVGNCLLTIKRAGFLGWGIRRKVKYIGRHRDQMSSPEQEEIEVVLHSDGGEQQRQRNNERKRKMEATEEERRKKKKRGKKKEKKQGKKKEKSRSRADNELKRRCDEEKQHVRGTKDRWSSERYEAAELKLLEIMKKKGAALGKPIMRQALREEARKHIGDTGLLDHLLKHMAGKVVTNGTERFRRRHNSEGAMEYWLEPADLVEVREKAGVSDTYWVPPPGWKPGDATSACPCAGECKSEILQLKEELAILKRDVQVLRVEDKERLAGNSSAEADVGCTIWQDKYKSMIERNNKLEKQIIDLFNCLQSLKEDILPLRVEKDKEMEAMKEDKELHHTEDNMLIQETIEKGNGDNNCVSCISDSNRNCCNGTNQSITTVDTAAKNKSTITNNKRTAERRSGFRICKPQGTFLWPDMWSSSGGGGGPREGRPQPLVVPNKTTIMASTTTMTTAAIEEHLMLLGGLPTPSSASSATSAHNLVLLPSPTSPVLTLPTEVMAVPPPPQYHHLHLQQRGSTLNRNVCPSVGVYHQMVAQVWEQTTSSPRATLPDVGVVVGNNTPELAGVASWDERIATDLALASPSINHQ